MGYRIERDFLGEKQLPEDAYYGVQTLRGKENFHITGIPMSLEPNFVKAFGYVKKAAALANRDLGTLEPKIADAIALANRGMGSLALSLFTHSPEAAREFIQGAAAYHGRMLVLNRDNAAESTGHGSPLPVLVHGGPGRAGGAPAHPVSPRAARDGIGACRRPATD